MKRLTTATLLVLAGLALGVILLGHAVRVRAGGAATPSVNGDVNGDGMIDVSDAVYTLLYLFKGGEPPVACADSAELVIQVEKLAARIQVLEHDRDCSPERRLPDRFLDNGDGTVTDPCTGLLWTRGALDVNADGLLDANDRIPWTEAFSFCENLSLAGNEKWRLPTRREVGTLPHVIGGLPVPQWSAEIAFAPSLFRAYFWTQDVYIANESWAWLWNGEFVEDGGYGTNPKISSYHVLAVRGP